MVVKKSIAYSYLKGFIFIVVLPTLLINIIINNLYINALQKNASDKILQAMEQVAIGVEDEVKRASLLTATIANDDEILSLSTKWQNETDSGKKYAISRQIDTKLHYLFNYNNDIDTVLFLYKNQRSYVFKNPPIVEEADIRKLDGYQRAIRNNGQVVITYSQKNFYYSITPHYTISVWLKPKIYNYRTDEMVVYLALRSGVLERLYSRLGNDITEKILLVEPNGRIFGTNDKKLFNRDIRKIANLAKAHYNENQSYTTKINGQKLFVTNYTIAKTGWEIIDIVDYRVLTNDIERIWRVGILVFGLLIGLFLIFTFIFFRDIILPVNHLIRQMKVVETGNLDVNISIKGNDEIYELGRSFNKMIAEIKKLMLERDLKEQARSKAELEALKFQINPHFISNTLNAVRLMAMIAKVDSIKNMVEAFIKLLNASFSKDEVLTAVAAEIENLQNYIYIMKVRYGDKFEVNFNINHEIAHTFILKMLLQPIVENSILHGVNELERKGMIKISGYRVGDDLRFEIHDNGAGMSQEQVQELLTGDHRNPRSFSSIGIKNVDQRIKLNYGPRYGLSIESVPGEFTKVTIFLPLIFESWKGEAEDVQSIGS